MSTSYTFYVTSDSAGKVLELDIPRRFAQAFEARYGYGVNEHPVREIYELRQLIAVFVALRPLYHKVELDVPGDEDVVTTRPGWYRLHVEDTETGELKSSCADIEIMAKLRWWTGRFAGAGRADCAFDVYDLDSWFFDSCENMLATLDDMVVLAVGNNDVKVKTSIG